MRSPRSLLLSVLLASLAATGCKKGSRPVPKKKPVDLRRLTPDSVLGWKARDAGRHFDSETVFDLLNGGAEIYLDYRLQRVLHREYVQQGRPTLSLHLFLLGSSPEAWGIFSHEREGQPAGIGQESDYEAGLLRFWRGRYLVSLQIPRETGPAKEALFALGQEIAKRIPKAGKRPDLVGKLPSEGQRPGGLRYVHTWPALDHHLRLGSDNPLGLDRKTEVALARYGDASPALHGLLVSYPSGGASRAGGAAKALNGRQAAPPALAKTCGALLVAAVGGKDAWARAQLLGRLAKAACGK